uniref:aldose epimerase family protein n=1 Tax=Ningiella ruwaisensis TaxID=2364274 RepID=UPI00109FF4BB|nr:aldose epimerase family protein [Ningiella ruwaisensis]
MNRCRFYTLSNKHSMSVTLCNYGARIVSIRVPNANGQLIETTFADQSSSSLLNDQAFKGATCGRVANRIGKASFVLEGQQYHLEANEGKNILHGGAGGFSQQTWFVDWHRKTYKADWLRMSYFSKDGDQGFPGNIRASVDFTLYDDNRLILSFSAESDKATPINMCNHSYFHLGEKDINALELQVKAHKYLDVDKRGIPTGRFMQVDELVNLNQLRPIHSFLPNRPLDHCYILDTKSQGLHASKATALSSARLVSRNKGIALDIFTDQEAMQVYTGNFLEHPHRAIALEAQGLIDAVNHAHFKGDFAKPDDPYKKWLCYRFSHM